MGKMKREKLRKGGKGLIQDGHILLFSTDSQPH